MTIYRLNDENTSYTTRENRVKLFDLNSPGTNHLDKVKMHFELASDLYRNEHIESATKHYIEGYTLAKKHNFKDYEYHFRALKTNYDPDQLCCNDLENEYQEIVSYFVNVEQWKYVFEYSSYLASYYKAGEEFELACDYYELAITASMNLKEETRS